MVQTTMVYLLSSANTIHGSNNHGVSVVFCYLVLKVGTTTIIDSRYAEQRCIASNNCHFDPRHSTVFNPPLINVITFIASFLRGATQGNVTSQPERTVPEMTHAQPWLPSPTADPHSHDCYMNTSYSMHNTQSLLPVNDNDVVTSIATIGTFEAVFFCLGEDLLASEEGFCSLQSVYLFMK